jgi:thioredoxin reductase
MNKNYGTVVPRTAVFVRPRFVPNADLLTGLGCEVDAHGWVVHDLVGRTSVAGVWVAGNAAASFDRWEAPPTPHVVGSTWLHQ